MRTKLWIRKKLRHEKAEKVLQSTNPTLDEEALRIVSLMPKWKPGRQSGKPEKVRYAIPVTFERAAKVP